MECLLVTRGFIFALKSAAAVGASQRFLGFVGSNLASEEIDARQDSG